VRSAAYGFTVGRMLTTAYLPRALAPGLPLSVEALGEELPAELGADVLYDPENARVRA
jgi:glycine cleavage system aminomethyltransferase T